jgi:hypothetical protein
MAGIMAPASHPGEDSDDRPQRDRQWLALYYDPARPPAIILPVRENL